MAWQQLAPTHAVAIAVVLAIAKVDNSIWRPAHDGMELH